MRKFLNVAMVFCFFFSSFININAQESQINLQEHYAIDYFTRYAPPIHSLSTTL